MMRAPVAKVSMKKMSTRSDRSAERLAADHLSSSVLIPMTTLSSRRGPLRQIL